MEREVFKNAKSEEDYVAGIKRLGLYCLIDHY